jgi:hypothetical protein
VSETIESLMTRAREAEAKVKAVSTLADEWMRTRTPLYDRDWRTVGQIILHVLTSASPSDPVCYCDQTVSTLVVCPVHPKPTLNCPVCGNGEEGECICALTEAFAEAEWIANGWAVREAPWSAVSPIKKARLMRIALPDAHAYAQGHSPDRCRPETCGGSYYDPCRKAVR